MSQSDKGTEQARPQRKQAMFHYKIEAAVETVVPLDRCALYNFGARYQEGLRKCLTVERSEASESSYIARRIKSDVERYEIITDHPSFFGLLTAGVEGRSQIKIRIKVADFTDEEAFLLAMATCLNNDCYNPFDVAVAIERAHRIYYKYDYQRMAARLSLEPQRLKSMIDIARWPREVLASFNDLNEIDLEMSIDLSRRLKSYQRRKPIIVRAVELAADLAKRNKAGLPPRPAKDVLEDLCSQRVSSRAREDKTEIRSRSGALVALLKVRAPGVGSVEIFKPPHITSSERREALVKLLRLLDQKSEIEADSEDVISGDT